MPRSDAAPTTPAVHDPPPLMRIPLLLLAVPSVLLGLVGLSSGWLPTWLSRSVLTDLGSPGPLTTAPQSLSPTLVTSLLSTLLVVVGASVGFLAWRRAASPVRDPAARLGRLRPLLEDGFFLDDIYDVLVVRPTSALAGLAARVDTSVVARAVRGSGESTQRLGATIRRLQDGDVQRYLTVLLAGAVLLGVAAWTTVGR